MNQSLLALLPPVAIPGEEDGSASEGWAGALTFELTKLAFDANPQPMWVFDQDTLRIVLVNRAAILTYGFTATQFESMGVDELYPAAQRARFRKRLARRADRTTVNVATRHQRADGQPIDVVVTAHPLTVGGQRLRLVTAQDVRAQVQAERARDDARRALSCALTATIEAVSATAEHRDPYTAGHQRRVASLAAAIADRMGLAADDTQGIQLAATIHDIGKIAVPAEILMYPGSLSPAAFELVKTHSQVGHDIVAGIIFPWPVPEMILQHHERLDGSGYPHGLNGSQIHPSSMILAVADVAEAISSHRPYRPALGIDAAADELRRGRGRLYTADTVDACLAVLADDGQQILQHHGDGPASAPTRLPLRIPG